MTYGSFDWGEDAVQDGAGLVEISSIFEAQVIFCFGTIPLDRIQSAGV